MGFFDFIGDAASSIGGALSGGFDSLTSGIGDWFGGGSTSALSGITDVGSAAGSGIGSALSGVNLGSNIDWGGAAAGLGGSTADMFSSGFSALGGLTGGGSLTPFEPMTSNAGVQQVAPPNTTGFQPTSAYIPGGSANPMGTLSGALSAGSHLLGGSGGQQQPTGAHPGTPQQQVAGAPQAGGGGGGMFGGGGPSISSVMSALPAIGNLFNKPTLGPEAGKLQTQADQNQTLVNSSILPTALANQQGSINGEALRGIDSSLQRQKAAMRRAYSDMGMSGSTMEAQDLAGLDANAQQQVFTTGQQMAATGLQTAATMTGQDVSIYQGLMQQQLELDKEYRDAMAEFAAAAVGGGQKTQVTNNIGQPGGISQPAVGLSPIPELTSGFPSALPATMPDLSGLLGSPTGGLSVPGLTDPNPATAFGGIDPNIDWSQAFAGGGGGGYQLVPNDISALLSAF